MISGEDATISWPVPGECGAKGVGIPARAADGYAP